MTRELSVYGRIQDPLEFVERMGAAIAKSQMFGCKNLDQGKVLAMACLAEGENPLTIARRYHIIDGNLSMRYDAMLAEFRRRGGKYEVLTRSNEEAEIKLVLDGQEHKESLTWEEAQKEPYVRDSKGGLKKNWRTPRARRQMLWARVVSEAVRVMCPEIVAGVYEPVELEAEGGGSDGSVGGDSETTVTVEAVVVPQPVSAGQDVTHEPTQETQPAAEEKPAKRKRRQVKRGKARTTEPQAEAESNSETANDSERSASTAKATGDAAGHASPADSATRADEIAGESKMPAAHEIDPATTPAGPATVSEIKAAIVEFGSSSPEVVKRISAHLRANGLEKLADMTQLDAEQLLADLQARTIERFFDRSLAQLGKNNGELDPQETATNVAQQEEEVTT